MRDLGIIALSIIISIVENRGIEWFLESGSWNEDNRQFLRFVLRSVLPRPRSDCFGWIGAIRFDFYGRFWRSRSSGWAIL